MTRRAVGASASPPRPAQGQDDLWHVFESTNDGITISTLDGCVIEVNPAMCAMHGYTREEFLALEPGGHVHPDFRGTRLEQYDRLRSGESYRMRARDLRKDGSEFDIEVHGTAMQFRGELHVLSVVRDISEQVKSETSLEQRVEQRTQELSTLLDVARVTASELDLTALIDRVFEQLASVVKYSAVVITLEERGRRLSSLAADQAGRRSPVQEGFAARPGSSWCTTPV